MSDEFKDLRDKHSNAWREALYLALSTIAIASTAYAVDPKIGAKAIRAIQEFLNNMRDPPSDSGGGGTGEGAGGEVLRFPTPGETFVVVSLLLILIFVALQFRRRALRLGGV